MNDFEQRWLQLLRCGLNRIGREMLLDSALEKYRDDVSWSADLMHLLKQELTQKQLKDVMCGCACLAGKDYLKILQDVYAETKDLPRVHSMLQDYFEKFIKEYKHLNEIELQLIRKNAMGMAGILRGNVITAVKIPKEFHYYYSEQEIRKKRYHYCHCPRIREALLSVDQPVDKNYCYCGAGFYQDIWEYVLQRPVKVEVVESLMQGNNLCKIEVHI